MSFCAKSYEKKLAAQQSERAAEEKVPMTEMSQYRLMLGKLRIDLRRLKMIKATDKKVEVKRDQLIPEYESYVDGVLEAQSGKQDDVLMYFMVWLIDALWFMKAITIAKYAIKFELKMPERFNRDVPDLVIEYICNIVLKKPDDLAEHAETLQALCELAEPHDMHDAVTLKLHKATGLSLKESHPEQSLIHLEKVYELDQRGGVSNIIKALKKKTQKEDDKKSETKPVDIPAVETGGKPVDMPVVKNADAIPPVDMPVANPTEEKQKDVKKETSTPEVKGTATKPATGKPSTAKDS